jgi:hypothetical protein
VKLDTELSDRIIDAIRPHLPQSTTIRRRRRRVLVVITRKKRFERATSSSASFGHLSRRSTHVRATANALEEVLRTIGRHLQMVELRWPGLAWGPVEITTSIVGTDVHALITDVEGSVLSLPPIATT